MFLTWMMKRSCVLVGFGSGRVSAGESRSTKRRGGAIAGVSAAAMLVSLSAVSGCGAGSIGEGIKGLSAMAVSLDAGQSYTFNVTTEGAPAVAWALSGADCTGAGCGTLSNAAGSTVVYTAPAAVSKAQSIALNAMVAGAPGVVASKAVISLSPHPLLTGVTLPATVAGASYSAALTVAGGTAPFQWSVASGSLPAGLALDPASGTLSGSPKQSGSYSFAVQMTDASANRTPVQATYSVSVAPAVDLSLSTTLPDATVGVTYKSTVAVSGGVGPYSCSVAGGSLPAGLTTTGCAVWGTPVAATDASVTIHVIDEGLGNASAVGTVKIKVAPQGLQLATTTLPSATVGLNYHAAIAVTGGVAPYACSLASGALPVGLTLGSCSIDGRYLSASAGAFTIRVSDSSAPAQTVSGSLKIGLIGPPLQLLTGALAAGRVGVSYTDRLSVLGGTAPYTCHVSGGALPAGFSLSACAVSGVPVNAGSGSVTFTVTDSSSPGNSVSNSAAWTIAAAAPSALSMATSNLPAGIVGALYGAPLNVAGGTAPYNCSITGGALPAGLALSGCLVVGTPSTAGSGAATIRVADAGSPAMATAGSVRWSVAAAPVAALTLVSGSLPGGVVGTSYSGSIGIQGGTAPYSCSITAGTLPSGVTLSGCSVDGTPRVAGSGSITLRVTDAESPAVSTTGVVSWSVAPAALALAKNSLPNGTAGVFYKSGFTLSGGVKPYTCSLTGGTLPAGMKLDYCTVLGTPTTAGAVTITVEAHDASEPASVVSGPVNLTIAPSVLTLGDAVLPNAIDGQPYAGSLSASGGTAPYQYSVVGGALPTGLSLGANGAVSGVATVAGSASFTAKVVDSGSPQISATHIFVITATAPALSLGTGALPAATVGQVYNAALKITGGTAPYSCSLLTGALPSGMMLSGCALAGTATTAGGSSVTIRVTDSGTPTQNASGAITLAVNAQPLTITPTQLPPGLINTAYSAALHVTGGVGADSCKLTSGALPAGLQMNAATCTIAGTPTAAGTNTVAVMVTDTNTPVADSATITLQLSVTAGAMSVTTASVANPVLGQVYTQAIQVTGGQAPYSFSIASGALPHGLSLAANGVVSGTPTAAGASSFVVGVTDSETSPQTVSRQFAPMVVYATGANNAQLSGSYAFLVQGYDAAQGSDLPYQTATAGSFVADGNGLVTSGEMDANHQSSTAGSGAAVPQHLIGTYEVGADDRGLVTLTTLQSDGSTGATITYEIAAAGEAPANGSTNPADVAASGGSPMQAAGAPGVLLLQDTAAFAQGLTGSYAFGMKGDTPCLTTCVVGITGGPVAEVGEFTAKAGAITGGVADSNLGAVVNANAALTGSYGSADASGRLQLTLNTANTPAGVYPTSYAAYVVNGNEALLLSTDSHATHVLLSGTAQVQTQSSFSNASMSGAVVGYENAAVDPGMLGVSLAAVNTAPVATVFRTTATADGNCSVTNADVAGGASLVSAVTAAGVNGDGITALLGAKQSTGAASCAVAANGRGVLTAPTPSSTVTGALGATGLTTSAGAPRVFYLIAPNRGYFLETGYAALGSFEPQAGAPFSGASLSGTYRFGTGAPSSAVSVGSSGVALANGSGSAVFTLDTGLTSQGLLGTGASQTNAYSLTDAVAGRFSMGTSVLYSLSPNRFVQIDLSPNAVSPSVGLMQR